MKKAFLITSMATMALMAHAQIAADNASNPIYIVGQEYIQTDTPAGDQTAAIHGLNGGFGFELWKRGGYGDAGNFGSTKISNLNPSFNMGSQQFNLRSGVGGLNYSGADARRGLLADLQIGQTLSWSMMVGGGGAGVQDTNGGDFGVEIRAESLSNPGRDVIAMNGSIGQNWSLQDVSGSIFTDVPVVPGQRVDVVIRTTTPDHYEVSLQPFGGLSYTYNLVSVSPGVKIRKAQFYCYQTSGDSYVNFLTAQYAVTGKLNLSDFGGAVDKEPIVFELINTSGAVVQTITRALTATGDYTLSTPLQGTFRVAAKGVHWLRKISAPFVISSSGAAAATLTLTNGDIDGDNTVSILDYSVLSDYFDKTSGDSDWMTLGSNGFRPEDADLDGDESVSILDYSVLSDAFDQFGD